MKFEKWYALVEKNLKRFEREYPPILTYFQLQKISFDINNISPKDAAEVMLNRYKNELENFEVFNGLTKNNIR